MIKVMLIDDNKDLIKIINKHFKNHSKIKISFIAYDGHTGFELIEKEQNNYDIIILDLIMPKKDGLYVLEKMQQKGINKKVIVTTSYSAGNIIREVSEYGVSYYILKPFELIDLEKRIINTITKETNFQYNTTQINLTNLLHELGIPSHIKGYQYLIEAINIIYKNPNKKIGFTTKLYPELAIKFETTVSNIESSIRHAIELSFNRGNIDLIENLFGHSININKSKPTNSEFIKTIVDRIKLDY